MATYTNGQIPTSRLVGLSGGGSLLSGPAQAWEQLRAAVKARYGWTPTLTDALSSYRPYATQERIFRQRYTTAYLPGRPIKIWNGVRWYLRPGQVTAAVPGTSNHGKGLAVDITGLGGFSGTKYKQLASVAAGLGWSNVEGRSIGEAWHWVYTGPAELTGAGGGSIGGSVPGVDVRPPEPPKEWDELASQAEMEAAFAKVLKEQLPTLLKMVSDVQLFEITAGTKATPSGWYLVDQGAYTKRALGSGQKDYQISLGLRQVKGQPGSVLDMHTMVK